MKIHRTNEQLELINRIDKTGISDVCYDSDGYNNAQPWDCKKYDIDIDNILLKSRIRHIKKGYEEYGDD